MVPWYLRDGERLRRERAAIEELAANVDWLVAHKWRMAANGMVLDAVIRVHGVEYELRLLLPDLFPVAPAVVTPVNQKERLSSHQYGGPDGPLCLEWGPDNWHPDVTGAQMLESAFKLLGIERLRDSSTGTSAGGRAPSRHHLVRAQEIRSETRRWLMTRRLAEYFGATTQASRGGMRFSLRERADVWIALIHELTAIDGPGLRDGVPSTLPDARESEWYRGVWIRTDADPSGFRGAGTLSALRALLAPAESELLTVPDGTTVGDGTNEPHLSSELSAVMLVCPSGAPILYITTSQGSLIRFADVGEETNHAAARAPHIEALTNKAVAIVGVGAAGSKVAETLVRMGANNLYLVDPDILLPANLWRHALDWDGVAQHKAKAVAQALVRIKPDLKVRTSELHITGQESNAAVNSVLSKIAACDMILDATANERVFSLLAAVAVRAQKPLCWLEVFGGGVGGLIARSRPEYDPTPQDMRRIFLGYCSQNAVPEWLRAATDYGVEIAGSVIVASDADVAIIAHHCASLIVDSLGDASASEYPHSMYLLGLSSDWVFSQPLANIPIMSAGAATWRTADVSAPLESRDVDFLLGLIKEMQDEADTVR